MLSLFLENVLVSLYPGLYSPPFKPLAIIYNKAFCLVCPRCLHQKCLPWRGVSEIAAKAARVCINSDREQRTTAVVPGIIVLVEGNEHVREVVETATPVHPHLVLTSLAEQCPLVRPCLGAMKPARLENFSVPMPSALKLRWLRC